MQLSALHSICFLLFHVHRLQTNYTGPVVQVTVGADRQQADQPRGGGEVAAQCQQRAAVCSRGFGSLASAELHSGREEPVQSHAQGRQKQAAFIEGGGNESCGHILCMLRGVLQLIV